ncbi:MAG: hypothetical protein KGD63_14225 [Candidatus Lokiarchaeota archaeon]|nr:hypothetical protein [Candidatus Lokiarchaeota archaeon]
MKKSEELGLCPNCNCSIILHKTLNYKRYAKCEICGNSYPLPNQGRIDNSALICPQRKFPILIIEIKDKKAYFWVDNPCYDCEKYNNCEPVQELIKEFIKMEVYGYTKEK